MCPLLPMHACDSTASECRDYARLHHTCKGSAMSIVGAAAAYAMGPSDSVLPQAAL